jgi:LmbE family N-acetylglucosaminyl deacetylase
MNVLAVGSHPDDLEILCGGTLAKYAARGDQVTMVCVANGDCGSAVHTRAEIRTIRRKEAEAAAAVIGARYYCLDYSDLEIPVDLEARAKLVDIIRRCQPDVIITHAANDYMLDHRNAGALAEVAGFDATIPNLKTESPVYERLTPVYCMDTVAGLGFEPTEYVDISEQFETKVRMLACHESQVAWLRHHDAINVDEMMEIMARFRGVQAGVRFAEGFRPLQLWGRVVARRLLP